MMTVIKTTTKKTIKTTITTIIWVAVEMAGLMIWKQGWQLSRSFENLCDLSEVNGKR